MATGGSLLQEFYGCLILLRLLTPHRSQIQAGESIDHTISRQDEWHKFLDNLAWLADHKCGGETVTAIAVEPSLPSPTFWIACNTSISPSVLQHIQSILCDLDQEASTDLSSTTNLVRIIARKSIELSWVRVKDYSRRLKGTMAAIDERQPQMTLGTEYYMALRSY